MPLRPAEQKLDGNMSTSVLLRDEAEAGIVVLRLNRPDSMNALNSEMVEALYSTFGELAEDRSVRAIVLTGAGRGFCSGADLNGYGGEHAVDPANPQADLWASFWVQKRIAGLIPLMRSVQVPVIAAVNGAACGGGLAIALGCDVRLAGPSARFNVAFVKVALSGCDAGVSWLLPRLIGASRAWELMLTGRLIDAAEADRLGLVSRLVSDKDVVDAAIDIAREIKANSAWGVRMTKEVSWSQLEVASLQAGLDMENRTQIMTSVGSAEHAEAVRAFLRAH
jgi:enoyl-CoA hydratase